MEIIFLGTSCMQPTKERNHPGVLVVYKGEGLLFDCGEGIQRQLRVAGIKPTIIKKVFISHWHGDHSLGLPGLIQTMGASNYDGELKIYGPKGTKKRMKLLSEVFVQKEGITLDVHEVTNGKIVDEDEFKVICAPLVHTTPCVGFGFIEKDRRKIIMSKVKKAGISQGPLLGKLQNGQSIKVEGKTIYPEEVSKIVQGRKIAYATDTRPCDGILEVGKDADILILESTFHSDLKEKAEEYFHLTAQEAASLANQAHAKKLILTHFSPRYKKGEELEEDARGVFDNTQAAKDFMKIKL